MFLGETAATQVCRRLRAEETAALADAAFALGDVTPRMMLAVVDQFVRRLAREGFLPQTGGEFVERVVCAAADAEHAAPLRRKLDAARRLEQLRRQDPRVVAAVVAKEHPQTIALIASLLAPEAAAAVVENLPPEVRATVVRRIGRMAPAAPGAVDDLLAALHGELANAAAQFTVSTGSARAAAAIVGKMNRSAAAAILRQLAGDDPELAERIERGEEE